MNALEHLLTKSCPPVLFHYTTQQGILGIVSIGELWATMSGYLNDSSEFHFAMGLAREVISGRKAAASNSKELRLLSDMERVIEYSGGNICVCSFSTDGDSLNQWRAYGAGGAGFAIGFDSVRLGEIARQKGYILVKCIYDEREQRSTFDQLVEQSLQENLLALQEGKYDEEDTINARNFGYYLHRYGLVFKDPAFREEKEWRLISKLTSYRAEGVEFRPGLSTLVPFQRVPISFENNDLPISHVLVGPTAMPDKARAAVLGLLMKRSRSLDRVKVGNSIIPFRGA